jgi:signal transduction histidine kinase
VTLSVQDDGCGFDPQAVPSERLGLAIMRERAKEVGAEVAVRSQLGVGTQVTVVWPAP